MIGNNFNYYNFFLNSNSFISPSQNVGINNIPKKPDNTSKANIDKSSFSFDSTHTDTQDKSVFNNFSNSLSDFAGLNNTQNDNKNNIQQQLSKNDIRDGIDNTFTQHNDKTYKDAIKEVDKYKKTITNSANHCGIDSGLLYGILVAEQMRLGCDDWTDGYNNDASKGFSQIKVDAAIQGENFVRQTNNFPELTKIQRKTMEESLSNTLCTDNDLNINCAAKYISFLQSQFPLDSKNLNREDQSKLIAAAYKAGPEAVKNARMQQQLNDLLNLKGDKKLTTDGDIGKQIGDKKSNTITAIDNLLESLKTKDIFDVNILNKLRDAKVSYKKGEYSQIRDVINLLWEKKHPDEKNPPGAVPEKYTYINDSKWRENVPLSVEDVIKAQNHFYED